MISETFSTTEIQKKTVEGDAVSLSSPSSPSLATTERREKQQRILLLVFASFSTFFYAGGVYGWGPMQLLLEGNGNFASRCDDINGVDNSTVKDSTNDTGNPLVCPNQTAAFLNCRFVSNLTLLSGTLFGILSDRYGKKVLTHSFGLCNIAGLVLLIIGLRFPTSVVVEDFSIYGAFILMGLGSTVGGMLTVETGLLFKSDHKQQNRVISLLNALFDAGAMAYLGLWGLEKLVSSSSSNNTSAASGNLPSTSTNTNLLLIIGGYLLLAVVCIGGYTYFFQIIQTRTTNESECGIGEERIDGTSDPCNEGSNEKDFKRRIVLGLPPTDDGDHTSQTPIDKIPKEGHIGDLSKTNDFQSSQPTKEESIPSVGHPDCCPYTPIAMRAPKNQLKSKAYVLLGIWFSFHSTSNLWTLTTARDFLGVLGDDIYGNRYLGIFTLLTPFSIVALPFLDAIIHKFGFHAALQVVNALAIVHGVIKVWVPNLDAHIAGFVVFTFFRCFLYSVVFSCVASFIGPTSIGKATGTLYVLSGLTSFFNIGLARLAIKEGDFFIPNLIFLLGTIPMIFLAFEIGGALTKDQQGLLDARSSEATAATTKEATPPSVGEFVASTLDAEHNETTIEQ